MITINDISPDTISPDTTESAEWVEQAEPSTVTLVRFMDRNAYASTPLVTSMAWMRVPRSASSGTVLAHGRDDSRSMRVDAPFITRARAEGKPVRTTTEDTEIRWVSDGPLEGLSDLWLFEAWEQARATGDRMVEEQTHTLIRARGFILSVEDVYEDQIVYHDEHGWASVLGFSDDEREAIEAGESVPSVWLYPENKPDHVPYDSNGYTVQVQFADLSTGQMRDGDGQSPLIAIAVR